MITIRISRFFRGSQPDEFIALFSACEGAEEMPVASSDDFLYICDFATRLRDQLWAISTSNVKIEYPEITPKNPAFESKLKYTDQAKDEITFSVEDDGEQKGVYGIGNTVTAAPTTSRQRSRNHLPFDSRGTLSGIKLQARNVAERATLSDYAEFVHSLSRLLDVLEDDVDTRKEEEKAKVEPWAAQGGVKKVPLLKVDEVISLRAWKSPNPTVAQRSFMEQSGTQMLINIVERLAGDEIA